MSFLGETFESSMEDIRDVFEDEDPTVAEPPAHAYQTTGWDDGFVNALVSSQDEFNTDSDHSNPPYDSNPSFQPTFTTFADFLANPNSNNDLSPQLINFIKKIKQSSDCLDNLAAEEAQLLEQLLRSPIDPLRPHLKVRRNYKADPAVDHEVFLMKSVKKEESQKIYDAIPDKFIKVTPTGNKPLGKNENVHHSSMEHLPAPKDKGASAGKTYWIEGSSFRLTVIDWKPIHDGMRGKTNSANSSPVSPTTTTTTTATTTSNSNSITGIKRNNDAKIEDDVSSLSDRVQNLEINNDHVHTRLSNLESKMQNHSESRSTTTSSDESGDEKKLREDIQAVFRQCNNQWMACRVILQKLKTNKVNVTTQSAVNPTLYKSGFFEVDSKQKPPHFRMKENGN